MLLYVRRMEQLGIKILGGMLLVAFIPLAITITV